jgi:hypothetical protein
VNIDIQHHERHRLHNLAPLSSNGWNNRLNLDGYLNFTGGGGQPSNAYTQLYRNGIVEAVYVYTTLDGNPSKSLLSVHYEQIILRWLAEYLKKFQNLNIEPPIYVFLTLIGVANSVLALPRGRDFRNPIPTVDRDELILPEIMIEEYGIDPAASMKPLFDMVWNAYGLRSSYNYDDQGNWKDR